ncbi:MAG: NAD-dependent epimerase/dehydratase [Berkelbacteria bacterium GW2011_GWA1_36_9]|uniref:NAD-dependent epimerase/dehydratase n=1 Tax=Berkelbacteria bacterium GW2011_GWA1_36_9 TaxID=1618331 RepID=A0A0G0FYA0_9BACT|nr:MAG: NAD-dependent epimerase/dehydratase [Berkelbacteria bacterium GW2011_GWA1_36_9]
MGKYIVTGGAGFIGSNIVKELVRRHQKVKVIDNLLTGKKQNIKDIIKEIDFVKGDICNLKLLQKEFQGYDYVLHQAALVSVPRSIAEPERSNKNNIDGTLNVLIASRDQKIKRVVCASSSSVYGDIKSDFKIEGKTGQLLSPYALTKYASEVYCRLFYQIYGLETICLRYFNVFGPNQNPESQYAAVIPKFITGIFKGIRPVIFGDGRQSRDFTFVKNNVEANILAAHSTRGAGEVFNIACGQSYSLNDLVSLINQELGTKIKPVYQKPRHGDIKDSKADINKAKKILGYKPVINFEEGLKKTLKWYQEKLKY